MKERSESSVVKRVLLALCKEFWPGTFWRQNAGKIKSVDGYWIELGPEGIADIVGFLPGGQIVFVECKRRSGKQRESQKNFQEAVEKAGAIYIVARSGDQAVLDVKKALKKKR